MGACGMRETGWQTPGGGSQDWRVYLLECADGSLYCGITTDLDRRLAQHNGLAPGGARYTRGRRPVRLLASRPCRDKPSALRLELAVKALPHGKKLAFLRKEGAC